MKKLLLCATDAGGARNLSPLLSYIQNKGFIPLLVTSVEMLRLFDVRDIKVIESENIDSEAAAIELLKEISPMAVVCGTTRYQSPERFLIAAARKSSVRSIVVLDEWFNYYLRFQGEDGKLSYLPDIICCQDEQARQEAVAEGIPLERLFVTGSPSLSALTFDAEKLLNKSPDAPDFIKNKSKPVITFLHETHSVDYGSMPGESGALGQFIGYTEHSVRQDIFDTLRKVGKSCTVIEKLHPSYQGDKIASLLGGGVVEWLTIPKSDLWPLFWHSDLVIGMRSITLLEAAILGCLVASYQPDLIGPQLCSAVRLNLIKSIDDKNELYKWLEKNISRRLESERRFIKRFPFVRDDVMQNVMDLIIAK